MDAVEEGEEEVFTEESVDSEGGGADKYDGGGVRRGGGKEYGGEGYGVEGHGVNEGENNGHGEEIGYSQNPYHPETHNSEPHNLSPPNQPPQPYPIDDHYHPNHHPSYYNGPSPYSSSQPPPSPQPSPPVDNRPKGEELLDIVFGPTSSSLSSQIRSRSPWGNHPGWRYEKYVVKKGEDVRREALVMQVLERMKELGILEEVRWAECWSAATG